jgi:hypothetical protein
MTNKIKITQLQSEINDLLLGKEHWLMPALEMHFFIISKTPENKKDYLDSFVQDTQLEPPFLPQQLKLDTNASIISVLIDNSIMNQDANIIKILQFMKWLIVGEINNIEQAKNSS